MINWQKEVEKRKEEIISETQEFLRINSVLDETTVSEQAPFGKGIDQALTHLLNKGKDYQLHIKNVDGYAGRIEYGAGEESLGVLCHIDVVPTGDGWTTPPFSADLREGKIFARGAIDNKGPTMAALFAIVLLKELGLPTTRRVQMIIGTDEESHWRCVEHYFKHEEMPTFGFAPDADFPIIHAEKGIMDVTLSWNGRVQKGSLIELVNFHSGERFNMVPDDAKVTLKGKRSHLDQIEEEFRRHLIQENHNGEARFEDDILILRYIGEAAHGSTPENGLNAGIELASFLVNNVELEENIQSYLEFVKSLKQDYHGKTIKMDLSDEVSGPLTLNPGLLTCQSTGQAQIGINIRYPVTAKGETCLAKLNELAEKLGATLDVVDHMGPNYVEQDHPLIQTLQAVYERQTGNTADLLAIGGGTYARSLKTGVAFGPMFPGRKDVAHQKDEYIEVDDLLQMTAIYAEAIYELVK